MHDHGSTLAARGRRLFAAALFLAAWLALDGTAESRTPAEHAVAMTDLVSGGIFLGGDQSGTKSSEGSADDTERLLTKMEEQLRARPAKYAPASEYRARCAASGQHDRAINFFKTISARDPNDARAQIELASAYVDKIPTCGGLTTSLCRGSLARKSLSRLNKVIARDRDSWVAFYCRGMNHLHWPRAFRHADNAAEDFQRCIELQHGDPTGDVKAYYVRAHIGLGDAHAKAKQFGRAIAAWREGLKRFPHSVELKERLTVKGGRAILAFVERQRSLDRPVDTSLAFLDP